jgi:hypothetical protein
LAEYAVLAAGIAVACSLAVLFLSGGISELWGSKTTPMRSAPFNPPSSSPGVTFPKTLADCENGGWQNYRQFTSQDECTDYVMALAP